MAAERDSTFQQPIGPLVDTSPAKRPQRTTLQGRAITVAPLDADTHGDSLYEGIQGGDKESLWLYLFAGPFSDRRAFDSYLREKAASEDPLFFTIVDNPSGKAVGLAAYMRIEPTHRVIEIGSLLFTPALQRTVGATEAIYLMARHAFEDLGYRRYEWKCNALNERSRRAALRLGFTFEGIFRQHMIVKGRSRDTAWFSMLDTEWPMRRAAFEAWLHTSNFDAAGRQKLPLSAYSGRRGK